MNSLTEENYLKEIYKLSGQNPKGVSTTAIAVALNIKAATVTDMVRKLTRKNLLKHEKYYGVTITKKGKKAALEIIRKHRLWEVFLVEKLSFKWDEVHPIAEQLEHIRSEELTQRLDKYLGYPKADPHGDPIPDSKGNIHLESLVPVSAVKKNGTGVISGVSEHDSSFLKYLESNSLGLGNHIQVLEVIDFDKSMNIKINRKKNLHISNKIARNILLKLHGK